MLLFTFHHVKCRNSQIQYNVLEKVKNLNAIDKELGRNFECLRLGLNQRKYEN